MPDVLTPFGTRSSDNVIVIPKGGQIVHDKGRIILLDGAGNPVHRGRRSNVPIGRPGDSNEPHPDPNEWTTHATWENTSDFPIESFTTNWPVPPYPPTDSGQTLFIYSAAQPVNYYSALLPVLQYGRSAAGGGDYWAVATWYITSEVVCHTPLTTVSIGDPLHAAINLTQVCPPQVCPPQNHICDYTARFEGINETVVNVRRSDELSIISLNLQGYNVQSADNYPPGVTVFYPTDVSLVPNVMWETRDKDPKVQAIVDVNTAVNGEITFIYPTILN